jgi:hypothetical protein
MRRRAFLAAAAALLVAGGLGVSPGRVGAAEKVPKVGPVKVNAHPASLEGKTIVLRWNGKFNGDKLLGRLGELIGQQAKGVKIVKLWEADASTGVISKDGAASEQVADKIAKLKADLVIAAQAD